MVLHEYAFKQKSTFTSNASKQQCMLTWLWRMRQLPSGHPRASRTPQRLSPSASVCSCLSPACIAILHHVSGKGRVLGKATFVDVLVQSHH